MQKGKGDFAVLGGSGKKEFSFSSFLLFPTYQRIHEKVLQHFLTKCAFLRGAEIREKAKADAVVRLKKFGIVVVHRDRGYVSSRM